MIHDKQKYICNLFDQIFFHDKALQRSALKIIMRTFSVQENILMIFNNLSIVDEADDKKQVKHIDLIQESIL